MADNLGFLGFDFVLDEGFVRNNDVLVFVVDLDDFEFHGLVDEDIVVADGLDIDLRTGEEGFDVVENGDDETAFGTALDVTGDDFLILVGLVDALPALEDAGFLVGEKQLTVGVFLTLDIDLNLVTDFEIGIVTQFGSGDDTVALESDVDNGLTVADADDSTLNYLLLGEGFEGLLVLFGHFFDLFVVDFFFFIDSTPVKICYRLHIFIIHVCVFCNL